MESASSGHYRSWYWRVIGPGGRVDEESPGIYSTEDECLANARANAMGWDARGVDSPGSPADEHLDDPALEGGDAVHHSARAGVKPPAKEVDIGSAVDGGASGDLAQSRVCSVAPSEPLWKIHRRKALFLGAVLLAGVGIAGKEIITRATGDLYERFFPSEASTPLQGNVKGIYSMTQDEYDALDEKDPNTLYVITDK